MDDDVCGKNALVKMEDYECASPLGSVKVYRAASCVCRKCIRVGKFAQLAKDCGPVKRSLEVNLSSTFSEYSPLLCTK